MRAPFQKAAPPRIRALDAAGGHCPATPKSAVPKGGGKSAPGHVFREFVATLQRMDKARRRKAGTAGPEA